MKLHLPKLLLTAVLAACVVSTAAWAETQTISTATDWGTDRAYDGNTNEVVINNNASLTLTSGASANTHYNYGTSITVEQGSTLNVTMWTGGGSDKRNYDDSERPIIDSEIILNNSTLCVLDGSYSFGGGITVSGAVQLVNDWSKGHTIKKLSSNGAAILTLNKKENAWGDNTPWILLNEGAFSGRVEMINGDSNEANAIQRLVLSHGSALSNGADKYTTVVNTGSGAYDYRNYITLNTAESYLKGIGGKGTIEVCSGTGSAGLSAAKLIVSNDGTVTDVFTGTVGSGVTLEIAGGSQIFGAIINNGTLTFENGSNVTLNGTITNNGTLNLNGAIAAGSLDNFSTITYGNLSNGTHGFTIGYEATAIATGGTITTGDFSFTLGGVDITDSLTIDNGNVVFIAENAATSRTTIYKITSAYTTAVEYNGTSGDSAEATGFVLANGTTVKLTGDYGKLKDGIKIAAGDAGSATVSIANAKSQTYDSLGLSSYIHKESGNYVLNIDGSNTEVIASAQDGTGFHTAGEVSITNGGKLTLSNFDTLGWGDTATPKISILNGTLAVGGRQTCSTDINMLGGAVIQAVTDGALTGSNAPMIQVHDNMDWTVSGTGNVVKSGVNINMNKALTIFVDKEGELSIQSAFTNSAQLTKTGTGTLILDGVEKTINGQLQMSSGTLQLGGTTSSDGLVTLAGGINQTAGTVKVAGNAVIKGDSSLGGALVVDSTGNLTLGKTYTLTGSLRIAEGGKLTGSADMTSASSGVPVTGTNGWDASIVTVLQTADANVSNISGLNKIWWLDGNSYDITTSSSEGLTSYTASIGVNYYVQDAASKVEYSTESGLTRAQKIYMSDATTLVVKNYLSTNKVVVADDAAVNYEVDGATLEIASDGTVSNISAIDLRNNAKATLEKAGASLGTNSSKVQINMSGDSILALSNGYTGKVYADISITDSAKIQGSWQGDYLDILGTIKGSGELTLGKPAANRQNVWTISSIISDKSASETLSLLVEDGTKVTLKGDNSYSGGTTIENGTLYTAHKNALGSGTLTINGGTLILKSDLTVGALAKNTDAEQNLNGHTMTVTGKATGSRIEVQNGTLIINDDLSLTGNLALKNFSKTTGEGDSAVTEIIGAEIQLCGDNNEVNVLDLSNSNNSKGKVVLKEGSSTRIRNGVSADGGALWMNSSSYIELEETASLSWGDVKVTGNDATKNGKISTTTDENLYLGSASATIANAKVEVSAGADTDVNNTLENVALYNNGSGELNITGTNNTLTELHALKGSISVTGQDEIVLNALTIAKGNTLTVDTVAVGSPVATFSTESPSSTATLEGGAKVVGNLDLSNANVLTLNGIGEDSLVIVTGNFVLLKGTLTLDGNILNTLAGLTAGTSVDVFSVGGEFTLGGQAINSNLTADSGYTLDTVFNGVSADYYLGYTVGDNGGGTVYIGKVIPEPTTATLSLLALAGLAARRRRASR